MPSRCKVADQKEAADTKRMPGGNVVHPRSRLAGVTEYSDPPENPGTGPDFTENMGLPK